MDERLIRVEEGLRTVGDDLSEIKHAMKDIACSMKTLAVLEEKHSTVMEAVKRAFKSIEKSELRIEAIEKAMPILVLTSGWVFKAILAVMAILGTAAVGVVIRGAVG